MMKNYILTTIAIVILIASGCDKSFLEPTNHNGMMADTYYSDSVNLKTAMMGIYKQLLHNNDWSSKGLYSFDMWAFADAGADLLDGRNLREGNNVEDFQKGIQTPNNSTVQRIWERNYRVIKRANDVLDGSTKVPDMPESLRERYQGEIRFLRALAYFNLIRIYGGRPHVATENQYGIPMMTQPVTMSMELIVPRGTVQEAYDFIIEDLKFAGEKLPTSWSGSEKGRPTKSSAWGLLSKVYMTQAGTSGNTDLWTKSNDYAKKVMDLGIHSLWTIPGVMNNAYATLFKIEAENSPESIFEIQCQSADYSFGENYNNMLAPKDLLAANAKGWVWPTQELVDMYEEGDLRKSATIFQPGDQFWPDKSNTPLAGYTYQPSNSLTTRTGYHMKKYITGRVWQDKWETGPANIRIMRYAEILLIRAEALNELNQTSSAVGLVNQVRNRAGLGNLPSDISKDDLRQAIWKERALELVLEIDRWFDLKRTDRINSRLRKINEVLNETAFIPNFADNVTKHYILPIPQRDIDRTRGVLVQAPDYQ